MSQTKQLQRILEGAIMAAGEPLTTNRMTDLFVDESAVPAKSDFLKALKALQKKYADSGFELVEVASGWRFQVKEDLAQWVNRLWDEKPQKYSRALLETLALIAYRQPLTRGDIEEVRGVAVSSHIIKTLVERDWVRVVGHRDVPGRPALFATTRDFLDYFNLKSLEELPALGELQDIQSLTANLDFGATQSDAKTEDDKESTKAPDDAQDKDSLGDTGDVNLAAAVDNNSDNNVEAKQDDSKQNKTAESIDVRIQELDNELNEALTNEPSEEPTENRIENTTQNNITTQPSPTRDSDDQSHNPSPNESSENSGDVSPEAENIDNVYKGETDKQTQSNTHEQDPHNIKDEKSMFD